MIDNPIKNSTNEDIIEVLKRSEKEIEEGKSIDADIVFNSLRDKFKYLK